MSGALWYVVMIRGTGVLVAQPPNVVVRPAPAPLSSPKPAEATDQPYAPQPILQGGIVLTLYPPDSPFLKMERIREAERYNLSRDVSGRINSIVNIHNPSIEVHLVDRSLNTGSAVILAPGGGHRTLNVGTEGSDFVPFFYNYGVNTVILRNRLRSDGYNPKTDAVHDAQQAIRLVRSHAQEWRIDPNRIGIMGFSAGAELAAPAALFFDEFDHTNRDAGDSLSGISSRPDFVGLVYPGPTPFAGGATPPIPGTVPPSFLMSPGSGDQVHALWATEYFTALLKVGAPNLEMHIYGNGHHPGSGSTGGLTDRRGTPLGTWQFRFIDWFRDLGFLQPPGVETKAAKDSAAYAKRSTGERGGGTPQQPASDRPAELLPMGPGLQYHIETLAGNGSAGDILPRGGNATELAVDLPFGVENGPDGALFITTVGSHRVLRFDRHSGRITSVAGTGRKGYAGDGGPATLATLNEPYEVRFDSHGNMLIVDMQAHAIRRVEAQTGTISTVAGDGIAGDRGDGGPARQARFRMPHSIALDLQDNLYVSDLANHRVRRIDARSGRIETIVGNGKGVLPHDGGNARDEPFLTPQGLVVRGDNLWIASVAGQSVWRLDRKRGTIHRVAGTGKRGYTGDGGDPLRATLDGPRGLMMAPSGILYLPEGENNVLRAVDSAKGLIWTVAGVGPQRHRYDGDGIPATRAPLWQPHGVCLGGQGTLIISDTINHRVRLLVPRSVSAR
jgi:endo-1,4-beta-xylanase